MADTSPRVIRSRTQRFKTSNIATDWQQVEAGVIQGSVLGPILFLLFIADINEYVPTGCSLMKYADDILAYILGRDNCNLAQEIANGVEKWCQVNKMRLNEGKCKVLFIPDNKDTTPPPSLSLVTSRWRLSRATNISASTSTSTSTGRSNGRGYTSESVRYRTSSSSSSSTASKRRY
ncbi:hypothetical protein KDA14_06090 [Candidatus Saccharibacteria bacterium]|nr:hypothetical protein [Candidatus Saccharibacteria bacterium]